MYNFGLRQFPSSFAAKAVCPYDLVPSEEGSDRKGPKQDDLGFMSSCYCWGEENFPPFLLVLLAG